MPLKLIAALIVAVILNKAVKGISFYRTAIYFPSLIGEASRYPFYGEIFLVLMAFLIKFFQSLVLKV